MLVVADPADDAPLPGAQAEGEEVAALFESFNTVYGGVGTNTVEVVRLFGPYQATRTYVLRHIMFTNFHVMHFAGHGGSGKLRLDFLARRKTDST